MRAHLTHADEVALLKGQTILLDRVATNGRHVSRQHRFSDMVEALPVPIYTTDAEGRIGTYNRAAAALWGAPPDLETARWCGTPRAFRPDGTKLPFDEIPMVMAIREGRAIGGRELMVEREDGARISVMAYPVPMRDAASRITGAVNLLVDITERKRAEARQALLTHELNHRVKNVLSVVQAMAIQTIRHSPDPAAFEAAFSARVAALSAANDALAEGEWSGASLSELAHSSLLAFGARDRTAIHIAGPSTRLGPDAATAFSLILHELATNAAKYRALRDGEGDVRVGWGIVEGETRSLHFEWVETGGPEVEAPGRGGFGSRLIQGLAGQLGARVTLDYQPGGLRFGLTMKLPAAARDV